MTKKNEPEMIPARKLPKYIGVEKVYGSLTDNLFRVYITKHMARTVPEWIGRHVHFWDGENRAHRNHVYMSMTAKDELEAYMRFCRMWQGLPTE